MVRSVRPTRPVRVALLATVVLGLTGCGSSDQITRAGYLTRANAICTDTTQTLRAIPTPAGRHPLAGYLAQALPLLRRESAQLRALPRPATSAGDRTRLQSFLTAFARSIDEDAQLAAAAKAGDAEGVSAAEGALQSNPAGSLATAYGLTACATPGSTAA